MSRQTNSRTGYLKLFIIHCSLFILLAACTRPDDTWEHIQEIDVLRVGMDASFPPFEYVAADGTLAGFDVDLETSITGPELVERVINFARAANSTIVAEKLIKIFTGD